MTFYAYAFPHRMARRWMASAGRGLDRRSLPINVRDESESFVLEAPVPGLKADDIKISVLDDVVSLEGEFPGNDSEYLLRELPGGEFRREIRLPAPLDSSKVDARISDGILTLRLPKAESAKPKTIKVEAK